MELLLYWCQAAGRQLRGWCCALERVPSPPSGHMAGWKLAAAGSAAAVAAAYTAPTAAGAGLARVSRPPSGMLRCQGLSCAAAEEEPAGLYSLRNRAAVLVLFLQLLLVALIGLLR